LGFLVNKVALGQIFLRTWFSPANYHSTGCSISSSRINHCWYNIQNGARHTKWIQHHLTPRNYKKNSETLVSTTSVSESVKQPVSLNIQEIKKKFWN
jgi:hypothetical protein